MASAWLNPVGRANVHIFLASSGVSHVPLFQFLCPTRAGPSEPDGDFRS